MKPETIRQIDQQLVQLIGQRIALSTQLEPESESEDIAPQLLAQAGVPEFVWQSLITSCTAASTATASSSSKKEERSRQVTIIGGGGKMGCFFTQQLVGAGHEVSILGRNNWDQAEKLLGGAELVLVCVPIEHTLTIIEKAAPYLASSAVLADLTSIKSPIVQAMLQHHSGPVIGLHPMFGPGVRSFLSQNMVVCPGRDEQAGQWFLDFLANQGSKLIFCTPEEHDQMMIFIQAIRHFSTFSLGVFLGEERVDLRQSLDFASPLYRLQLDMVSRLFAQDSSLCLKMMLSLAERRQAISRLANTYSRLASMVEQEDEVALKGEFAATKSFFNAETNRALVESNYVINSLSMLLAANQTETSTISKPVESKIG